MMIQVTTTNLQEALQVPQSSCFPFAHHWLIFVAGNHLFLTDTWCYLPRRMLLSEKEVPFTCGTHASYV